MSWATEEGTGGTPTDRNCDYFLVSWAEGVASPYVGAGEDEASGDPGPCAQVPSFVEAGHVTRILASDWSSGQERKG